MQRRPLLVCSLALCGAAFLPARAQPTEVNGVRFASEVNAAGTKLVLNGAGVRHKIIFPMYALGLYLPQKTRVVAEASDLSTPKRLVLRPLRDLPTNELGRLLTRGIETNATKDDFVKIVPDLSRLGQLMAQYTKLVPNDTLLIDWKPGVGMALTFRGKAQGPVFPEPALFRTLLKIWLGDQPADAKLKSLLMGETAGPAAVPSSGIPSELL